MIVVATRPEEELGQRLGRTADEADGDLIELRALSGQAVRGLVSDALDQPPEAEFSEAFDEATCGNPFLVHGLLRTVQEEGISPDADGARTSARSAASASEGLSC